MAIKMTVNSVTIKFTHIHSTYNIGYIIDFIDSDCTLVYLILRGLIYYSTVSASASAICVLAVGKYIEFHEYCAKKINIVVPKKFDFFYV